MAACWGPLALVLGVACQTRTREAFSSEALASAEPLTNTSPSAESAPVPVGRAELTLRFDESPFGRVDVVVRVPEHRSDEPPPTLIAFHGRGETLKGPKLGARGWLDDYRLEKSATHLKSPPLSKRDFLGAVADERLQAINEQLDKRPFRDLAVIMPYLPDVLKGEQAFKNGPVLAGFLLDQIVPRVAREFQLRTDPDHLGIDGVSLGGRAALFIGFERPEAFRALGATQPAIDARELDRLVSAARHARSRNRKLDLRLLTSQDDYYRTVVEEFSQRLTSAGVKHRLDVVFGNHSYDFNRGPGGIEMLLHHSTELWP